MQWSLEAHLWWSRALSTTVGTLFFLASTLVKINIKNWFLLSTVGQAWNSSTLGGHGRSINWSQEFETSLGNKVRPHYTKKLKKHYPDMVMCACSPSCLGGWGGKIGWALGLEAAVSCDHTTAIQPGQQSQTLSLTKKIVWTANILRL